MNNWKSVCEEEEAGRTVVMGNCGIERGVNLGAHLNADGVLLREDKVFTGAYLHSSQKANYNEIKGI